MAVEVVLREKHLEMRGCFSWRVHLKWNAFYKITKKENVLKRLENLRWKSAPKWPIARSKQRECARWCEFSMFRSSSYCTLRDGVIQPPETVQHGRARTPQRLVGNKICFQPPPLPRLIRMGKGVALHQNPEQTVITREGSRQKDRVTSSIWIPLFWRWPFSLGVFVGVFLSMNFTPKTQSWMWQEGGS